MKTISKITVKHFLNTLLGPRSSFVEITNGKEKLPLNKEPEIHPLYVGVIFKRKTTQLKSIIDDDFASLEVAQIEHGEMMKAEIRMIEELITREFIKQGDSFKLKGLKIKCQVYNENLLEFLAKSYIWDQYCKIIEDSQSPKKLMLTLKIDAIPASEYYDAAIKLIGKTKPLMELQNRFEIFSKIESIIQKDKIFNNMKVIEWKYGKAKEYFSLLAINNGLKFDQLTEVVRSVDDEINKLE